MENREAWTHLHTDSRYRPKYPSDNVVRFVFRNFERNGTKKVLDLGCGAGRHVFFMGREGIIPYGVDFSSEGIDYTKKMLDEYGMGDYVDNMKTASLTSIPFESEMFDGIICNGVLYYLSSEDIQTAIKEMHRVLKKDGKLYLVVRSTEDYRCNSESFDKTEEKNTFIINEKHADRSAFSENGMLMHFFERDEIEELLQDFKNVVIDKVTESHGNDTYCDCNFIITAQRG